jgi:uncharacterized protein (DUF1778 family)
MVSPAILAYLDGPQDERFETRMPGLLKRHAERIARAKGSTLSQYILAVVAERVSEDIVEAEELHLTATEQAELLRVLAAPAVMTPQLDAATARAKRRFSDL